MNDDKLKLIAKRLANDQDFEFLMDHLVKGQAAVVLSADPESTTLGFAHAYYIALTHVRPLINSIAQGEEVAHG